MGQAWITREWYDASDLTPKGKPKRKRNKVVDMTMKGVHGGDRFVVEWLDPDGSRRTEKIAGVGRPAKSLAIERWNDVNKRLQKGKRGRKVLKKTQKTWAEFKAKFIANVLATKSNTSQRLLTGAIARFERIAKPNLMRDIDTEMIDGYKAARSQERGKKPGSTISPASVNKDLRYLRSIMRKAAKWEYLRRCPDFDFFKDPEAKERYVTPEHFDTIYAAVDAATLPRFQGCETSDWWRALLVTALMTGWRANEILTLQWSDVDLDAGRATLRAENTKGRRSERHLPLHPIVVEHLAKLRGTFRQEVFGWDGDPTGPWAQFHAIQKAAGIKLDCHGDHEHTDACHLYGFHDLRRAFATMNAGNMTADALQRLMRHKSYTTTQRYINAASQVSRAVANLHVPTLAVPASA